MGMAFDNFDELTQTLSGSNTLHDTMGILYQNIAEDKDVPQFTASSATSTTKEISSTSSTKEKVPKKKRSLTVSDDPLGPYFGVPKMTTFHYSDTNVFSLPDVTTSARQLDLVWMISHALQTDLLPMWVGFNAKFHKDSLPRQEIYYMPNLKEPITS